MYICNHFKIHDLVSKNLYESHSEGKLWQVFDDRALITLDMLWEQYGKFIINNWKNGGVYQFKGLKSSEDVFNQQMSGRGFICKFCNIPSFVVRCDTIDNKYECFKHITAVGSTAFDYYFDTRNNKDKLIVLKLENENENGGVSLKYECK